MASNDTPGFGKGADPNDDDDDDDDDDGDSDDNEDLDGAVGGAAVLTMMLGTALPAPARADPEEVVM